MFDKINIGTAPDSGDGDTLRNAFNKVNENYDDTYTKGEVDDLIDDVEVDLSNYYNKAEVDGLIDSVEVDLSNYDTSTEVDSKINSAIDGIDVDLSNYDTSVEVDNKIDTAIAGIDVDLSNYDTSSEVDSKIDTAIADIDVDLTNYYDKAEVDSLIDDVEVDLSDYDTSIEVDNKIDAAIGSIDVDLDNYYDKTEVDALIDGVEVDLSNYDTSLEVDNKINTAIDDIDVDLTNYYDKDEVDGLIDGVEGVEEAPIDGKQYARQNANWTEVQSGDIDPTAQNLALVGTNSYKLLTTDDTDVTHGSNSLFFADNSNNTTPVILGKNSVSFGDRSFARGNYSMAGGVQSSAVGGYSIAWGYRAKADHYYSFALGHNVETANERGTVVGTSNSTTGTAESSLFTVGNGGLSTRKNALEVLEDGIILAPDLTTAKLNSAPIRALTTKEYVNSLIDDVEVDLSNYYDKEEVDTLIGSAVGIGEAPLDGQQYARQSGDWTVVDTSGGGGTAPGSQNLQLVGTNSYKILTNSDTGITHGNRSLYFADRTGGLAATLGDNSVSFGRFGAAEGYNSMVGGLSCSTSINGNNSIAWGQYSIAHHPRSFAFGNGVETTKDDSMVVGKYNSTTGTATSSYFTVGGGSSTNKANILEVLGSGEVLTPTTSIAMLNIAPDRALVTKEYVKSTQNLELVGTNSYKLLTNSDTGLTYGNNSLFFGEKFSNSEVTLGTNSVTFGSQTYAQGSNSMVGGYNSATADAYSIAWGASAYTLHNTSFAFGTNINTPTANSMVVGRYNSIDDTAETSLFTVGNGNSFGQSNALEVLESGVILAPTLDISDLGSAPSSALTTKEYVESPSRLIEALTNATQTELDEIKGLLGIV